MAKVVLMPKLGLTMKEGKVSKWHKQEGDEVVKGDALCDVETDKITNTVEATEAGLLRKIIVPDGIVVPVSDPIGIVGLADEDISGLVADTLISEVAITKDKKESIKVEKEVQFKDSGAYVKATPYAKKLAREKNFDLSVVRESSENNILTAKDILDFDSKNVKMSPVAAKMAKEYNVDLGSFDSGQRVMKDDIRKAMQDKYFDRERIEKIAPSTMRKVIAERMHDSWMTSPRVTYNMEVDATEMKNMRNVLKGSFEKDGLKISYNHILIKIITEGLMEYPYLNASFDGENIIIHNYVNIGVAVDVNDGLLVPNLKDVQNMNLKQISSESQTLIENAQSGRINPDDLVEGTFTITNVGMFGIDSFSPIINQPEVAILGVNRIVDKPVVIDGQIVIRPMLNLSLSADHRLVDGAMAAKFLARVKELIENPYLLLE